MNNYPKAEIDPKRKAAQSPWIPGAESGSSLTSALTYVSACRCILKCLELQLHCIYKDVVHCLRSLISTTIETAQLIYLLLGDGRQCEHRRIELRDWPPVSREEVFDPREHVLHAGAAIASVAKKIQQFGPEFHARLARSGDARPGGIYVV